MIQNREEFFGSGRTKITRGKDRQGTYCRNQRAFIRNKRQRASNCLKLTGVCEMSVTYFTVMQVKSERRFTLRDSRDFVRTCEIPILVMPDDAASHPYAVAMETARLAPNGEVSLYPWREPSGHIELAVRHVRTFLKAHTPATE